MMTAQTVIVNANAIVLMLQKVHQEQHIPTRPQRIKPHHLQNPNFFQTYVLH